MKFAYATSNLDNLVGAISDVIIEPLIWLIFTIATLYFLFGLVKFILSRDNQTERKKGQSHMFWGIVGMAIMVSAWGIINLIIGTLKNL